jgi:phage baseplate assembly protein W
MSSVGFSPKLPLIYDSLEGPYKNLKTYREIIRQNFKMLLLTIPGERVMIPSYGVGLATYLFEPNIDSTYNEIERKIVQQVQKWMPFIEFESIVFDSTVKDQGIVYTDSNFVSIEIKYFVPVLSEYEVLSLTGDLDRKIFI